MIVYWVGVNLRIVIIDVFNKEFIVFQNWINFFGKYGVLTNVVCYCYWRYPNFHYGGYTGLVDIYVVLN